MGRSGYPPQKRPRVTDERVAEAGWVIAFATPKQRMTVKKAMRCSGYTSEGANDDTHRMRVQRKAKQIKKEEQIPAVVEPVGASIMSPRDKTSRKKILENR